MLGNHPVTEDGHDDDVQITLRWLTCSACGESGLMVLNEDGTEPALCGGCEREQLGQEHRSDASADTAQTD